MTKEEMTIALENDKKYLAKMKIHLAILQRGGYVENLTISGAIENIECVSAVIKNKERILAECFK